MWTFVVFLCLSAMASDCHELFLRGETTSGLYTIQPADSEPFEVFCEMTPGKWRTKIIGLGLLVLLIPQNVTSYNPRFVRLFIEGGWTVIQRRQDGSVDFDQLWQAYQTGFGSLNGKNPMWTDSVLHVSK